ncbi:MAG: hypothetical protein AUK63_1126 [bacterium P3]|nr:MAG: hypothetical protein AUK63_1126 [bacterium P3]KWW40680.1 MAG: hypothetical protein F083_1474 [bacterium F083]
MNRLLSFAMMAGAVAIFSACSGSDEQQLAAQRTQDSLQAVIDAKDNEVNALFEMLNQIEDNLAAISAKYGNVQKLRQRGVEGNINVRGEINDQLANIESMLAANKAKISELNRKLAELGRQNTELQDFVARLEQRMTEQEQQIAGLTAELEQSKVVIRNLNQSVSELTDANAEKEQTIARQIAESNKAYFIVGTYAELKEAGIVSKSGGFIGIGRRQGTVADMPLDRFVQIDRSKVTTVAVNMRNAVVISSHPESSYELVSDENDEKVTAYLRILNPALFWQQTKYLIISTK